MNRFSFLFTLLLTSQLSAQISLDRLADDPMLATDVYHLYEYSPSKLTAPPRGYKAVYLSHYGRHGERFLNRESYIYPGLEVLKREPLTPLGEKALAVISDMEERSRDNWGALSPLGAKNHKAIAGRMFQRNRRIFRSGRTVRCEATDRPRCIVSMANAASVLAASRPGLNMEFVSSRRFHCYTLDDALISFLLSQRDSLFKAHPGAYDCIGACFAVPSNLSPEDLSDVATAIFFTWKDMPCLEMTQFDIREFFSEELLFLNARHSASWDYCLLSKSKWWNKDKLAPIFNDIVDRAEEALESGNVAADLRFGHDSQLIPIYTALGLAGDCPEMSYADAPDVWDAATVCPMTSNLQIVFYKNRKGSVLVKVLKDEQEVKIPSLSPVKGPYYHWEDFAALLRN